MIEVIFEPHTATKDDEGVHRASGWRDVELSKLGVKQAKELGMLYKDEGFDVIFCSDLQRAYRTAEIAFSGRSIQIVRDKRLRECNFGDLAGAAGETVKAKMSRRIVEPFPNGESYTQLVGRVKDFLNEMLKGYNSKRVMIIAHKGVWYSLEHIFKKIPLEQLVGMPFKSQEKGYRYLLQNPL